MNPLRLLDYRLVYGYRTAMLFYEQVIVLRCGTVEKDLQLDTHIAKVAKDMGIQKPLLVTRTKVSSWFSFFEKHGRYPAAIQIFGLPVSSFGNTLLPGMIPGISVRDNDLDNDQLRFFATREVAQLKTHDALFKEIIGVIVVIAATIFFPTIPWISPFFIGGAASFIATECFAHWNDPRIDDLVCKHTTLDERAAALSFFTGQLAYSELMSTSTQSWFEQQKEYVISLQERAGDVIQPSEEPPE